LGSYGYELLHKFNVQGNVYPVIEKADKNSAQSLYGKPCKEGFDSHYVLVKDKQPQNKMSLDYQPCDPSVDVPDYDEVVVFNRDQVLPRYLVYYSRISENNTQNNVQQYSTQKKVHLLWVDPNDISKTIAKLQAENIVVSQFSDSKALMKFLENVQSKNPDIDQLFSDTYFKIASNRYRAGDGDEVAGIRLLQSLRQDGNPWKKTPFILFCGSVKAVKPEFPVDVDIFLTDKEQKFIKYVKQIPTKNTKNSDVPPAKLETNTTPKNSSNTQPPLTTSHPTPNITTKRPPQIQFDSIKRNSFANCSKSSTIIPKTPKGT
jgi:hypothetical protein